jgi:DNA adenine methylase
MRNPHSAVRNPQRPLLKWAGGKRQLLPQLRRFYPEQFGAYIEPFVGSGAVFFDLLAAGRLDGHDVTLIDANPDLIGCYELVRDEPAAVAEALEALAAGHAREGRAFYYRVRDEQFNPERARRRSAGGRIAYTPALAAMFVYLNRTGYNGLFRVNSHGAFNVPAGRYVRPDIANRARLNAVADALGRPGVHLQYSSFTAALAIAKPGDFLYIDPPYEPVSRTANFTSYTDRRFDARDQKDLHEAVLALARQGSHVLLSNSTAQHIARLYDRNVEARRAGLRALRVPARRAVNSNATRRGPVFEYLITNQP